MPHRPTQREEKPETCRLYLVPCSCGASFSVPADYDRLGGAVSRYLTCPECGKRHDPRNRLLQLSYTHSRFWRVESC